MNKSKQEEVDVCLTSGIIKSSKPKSFWHINRGLLPMKFHFFLFVGAVGAALPYMTVFAKNRIGLTATSFAVVLTVQQFLFIFTRPLIGYIADYFHKLKTIIFVLTVIQAVSLFALLAIPRINTWEAQEFLPVNETDICARFDRCGHHFGVPVSDVILDGQISTDICPRGNFSHRPVPKSNTSENQLFSLTNHTNLNFFKCNPRSCTFLNPECGLCCDETECRAYHHCDASDDDDASSDFRTFEFWSFAAIYTLSGVCTNGLFTLSDAACCESVHKLGGDFGRQRLYGTVGNGLAAVAAGYLNDHTDDYLASWCLMSALSLLTLCNLCRMDLSRPKFSQNVLKSVGSVLGSSEYIAFASAVFVCGMGFGTISFYLVWFLTTIGGSRFLCGLTLAVQCFVGEIPFLFFSGWIVKKMGHFNVMTLALASYAVRFAWYSRLHDPWWVLPVDCLHGFTFGVFYATVASYAKLSAKPGTETTTLAVLFTTHEGLGAGLGCVLAGMGIDRLGTHQTFLIASILSGCGAVGSVLLSCLVNRRRKASFMIT